MLNFPPELERKTQAGGWVRGADRLYGPPVRTEERHPLIQQILKKDLAVFLRQGKPAEYLALGIQQDVFKAPALGAVEDEAFGLPDGKGPAFPQRGSHPDRGPLNGDAAFVYFERIWNCQPDISVCGHIL